MLDLDETRMEQRRRIAEHISLTMGNHPRTEVAVTGMCVMEMASFIAGEEHSDRPLCVNKVLALFLRALNDFESADLRESLRPYALRALGTSRDPKTDEEMRRVIYGWAQRVLDLWADHVGWDQKDPNGFQLAVRRRQEHLKTSGSVFALAYELLSTVGINPARFSHTAVLANTCYPDILYCATKAALDSYVRPPLPVTQDEEACRWREVMEDLAPMLRKSFDMLHDALNEMCDVR